jgi:O-acetylhomoserine (thiol)-lyase
MKSNTIAIHGGYYGEAAGSTAVPIHQTVSYAHRTAKELADVFAGRGPGYIYTRLSNPTTSVLEARMTQLENGIGAIATASGMAAITSVVMGLLRAGDEIIAAKGIFGGTVSLLQNTLSRFGIATRFVDVAETSNFAEAINEKTKLIFVETIGNPRMDVGDLPEIAAVAHRRNIPFAVDSTLTTPFIVRPGEYGADIVIHSTSKFINGHGTAIGGCIVDTGNYGWGGGIFDDIKKLAERAGQMAFLGHLRNVIYRDLGGCAAPFNSFLMLQGLETLAVRMEKHCRNAERLAAFFDGHEKVEWVNYPGLPASRFYERVRRLYGGRAGGLLTFGLPDRERAWRFIDSLKLAKNVANLGDAKTLVIHPASTIFHEFDENQRAEMGVGEGMVRVSVGLEDTDDIVKDFEVALDQA